MLFNSYSFLFIFLPVALIGYYGLAKLIGAGAARAWLVIASFVFYGWMSPVFVPLLMISIAVNYTLSELILRNEEREGLQKLLLTVGITLNILALCYYKYLSPSLDFLYHAGLIQARFSAIVLPIGISFFTFTQVAYLVDCQQGVVRERSPINYILFVTFFPHLIAGPILHHREIMPQFAETMTYRWNDQRIAAGFTLFIIGLVKKVLLADNIAPYAEAGFDHVQQLGTLGAWSTIFAYSMQLYFDFSGYSDMALGLGAMFGVKLPLNFNSPYKAGSIIEFWQRWHMTLTRYLTLLIYNPISLWVTRRRMRRGVAASRGGMESWSGFSSLVLLPTFVTLFVAGIWHGAGFQFIIFGLLHASYLSINHAWRTFGPKRATSVAVTKFAAVWPVLLTYAAVLLAQVFFRAANVDDAFALIGRAFGSHGSEFPLPVWTQGALGKLGPIDHFLSAHGVLLVTPKIEAYVTLTQPLLKSAGLAMLLAAIAWGTPNAYQMLGQYSPSLQTVPPTRWKFLVWRPNYVWAILIGTGFFVAITRLDHPGRFLYFQF